MKRIVATVLLLLVMGLGTPQVFADDPLNATGVTPKPTELPGSAAPGDSQGTIDDLLIYIVSSVIP
ncbi:MAG TPA: hypothetical protein VGC89_04400 [Pyrinomonadaceae bacterium]|jgi:hypothetical protein